MAETRVPNMFSNFRHQFVCKRSMDSVFFVKVSPESSYRTQVIDHLMKTWNISKEQAEEIIKDPFTASGFVVSESETTYSILTCAHLFEEFYSAEVRINLEELNSWFQVLVICQHFESHMIATFPNLYAHPNHDPRFYTPATVVKFDQKKDLMLLKIDKSELYADRFLNRCEMPHRALRITASLPNNPDDVLMVSWPPGRKDSVSIGHMVSHARTYPQMTRDLSKGYDMNLFELNIAGGKGSSGAPVLNNRGHYIGLFHARSEDMGYAVSADDIFRFCFGFI